MWPAQMARIAYDRFHFADAAPGHPFRFVPNRPNLLHR